MNTTPFRKILIPTDGSDRTGPAIRHGLELAKFIGAEVTAICVNDTSNYAFTPGDTQDADTQLHRMSESAVRYVSDQGEDLGIAVRPLIVNGIPADKIIEASRGYDLIVMGTIGRTGLAHLLLGSVAEKVLRFASCPVMVVRGTEEVMISGSGYHRILVPTDGSDNTRPAIACALELARAFNAEVTAMSVGDVRNVPASVRASGTADQHLIEIGQSAVGYVVDEGRKLNVRVKPIVVTGHPANEIVSESSNYDLVIMGTLGHTGLAYLRLGSVAEKTVRHAKCPVLVVRTNERTRAVHRP